MGAIGQVIQVRVAELKQLFNAIDPSPFGRRDLDPKAEEFIVSWAREVHGRAPLSLVVHLGRAPGEPREATLLEEAVRGFFQDRAGVARRRLRQLFRQGRVSLLIGMVFLAGSIGVGGMVESAVGGRLGVVVRESLLIGGWVAMWRPLEVFLYDWWPILTEIRLYERLSAMPVRIEYAGLPPSEAWRADWPAAAIEPLRPPG